MHLARESIEKLILKTGDRRRFTQDSPVLPEVWIQFGLGPLTPQDLLLTPHRKSSAGRLSVLIRERAEADRLTRAERLGIRGKPEPLQIAYTQSYVAARLYFDELMRVLLPLTNWWDAYVFAPTRGIRAETGGEGPLDISRWREKGIGEYLTGALKDFRDGVRSSHPERARGSELPTDLLWMLGIAGPIAWAQQQSARETRGKKSASREVDVPSEAEMVNAVGELYDGLTSPEPEQRKVLWLVNRNRPLEMAIRYSGPAVKADAARNLFNVKCSKIRWAIVDSGIDADHPAFTTSPKGDLEQRTRVVATYDFSRLRPLLDPNNLTPETPENSNLPQGLRDGIKGGREKASKIKRALKDLRAHLESGREMDWDLLEPLLRIPHDNDYPRPTNDHGTHVAGILGADWKEEDLIGVCPDIRLYDLRVLDEAGRGDEFSVLGALQFIQHLNGQKEYFAVHGANLSLSLRHEVANYACGHTPVCEECERLAGSGVVVVAAAGNLGYLKYNTVGGVVEGYQDISITDPGNGDSVITVGATHRYRPHTYGVSYFSSRGPTGDGRFKPDLVAPGEKITSTTPGEGYASKDGTSMAAPHVSGAAAMLMARHTELVGQPARIKQILCDTATDLERERYFQGCGMLDILRAIQSV